MSKRGNISLKKQAESTDISDELEGLFRELTQLREAWDKQVDEIIFIVAANSPLTSIGKLPLSPSAVNLLNKRGVSTVGEVLTMTPEVLSESTHKWLNNFSATLARARRLLSDVRIAGQPHSLLTTIKQKLRRFEENMLNNLSSQALDTDITSLVRSQRAIHALESLDLLTTKAVLSYGLDTLKTCRGVGAITMKDIKTSIFRLAEMSERTTVDAPILFKDALASIVSVIRPKHRIIFKWRYEENLTLANIGDALNRSRERIRQILKEGCAKIKRSIDTKVVYVLIKEIDESFAKYHGVLCTADLMTHEYFAGASENKIRFILSLLVDLYEENYHVLDNTFFTSLDKVGISKLKKQMQQALYRLRYPLKQEDVVGQIDERIGKISSHYLWHYILAKQFVVSEGMVLSPGKLTLPNKINFLLSDREKPLHYTDIAQLCKDHYGITSEKQHFVHNVHHSLLKSKDFILVAKGSFILRTNFKEPSNLAEIKSECISILLALETISDTKYLIRELKKRRFNIGNLNHYSLKQLLIESPEFVGYRRFAVGLNVLSERYNYTPLSTMIYDILCRASRPLRASEICETLNKQRGVEPYRVGQILSKETRFIRVSAGVYTLRPQQEQPIPPSHLGVQGLPSVGPDKCLYP